MLVAALAQPPDAQAPQAVPVSTPTVADGVALASKNRTEDALDVFQAVVLVDPSNHDAHMGRATVSLLSRF
jgi:hypothetical protein